MIHRFWGFFLHIYIYIFSKEQISRYFTQQVENDHFTDGKTEARSCAVLCPRIIQQSPGVRGHGAWFRAQHPRTFSDKWMEGDTSTAFCKGQELILPTLQTSSAPAGSETKVFSFILCCQEVLAQNSVGSPRGNCTLGFQCFGDAGLVCTTGCSSGHGVYSGPKLFSGIFWEMAEYSGQQRFLSDQSVRESRAKPLRAGTAYLCKSINLKRYCFTASAPCQEFLLKHKRNNRSSPARVLPASFLKQNYYQERKKKKIYTKQLNVLLIVL